jgi:hypothetical protein
MLNIFLVSGTLHCVYHIFSLALQLQLFGSAIDSPRWYDTSLALFNKSYNLWTKP